MTAACGTRPFSTHNRYPRVRINGTPWPRSGTHKRYPHPCSCPCSSLPVEARSTVEGAHPIPHPGNPSGIPPPPTAATTAERERPEKAFSGKDRHAGTEHSKQCPRNTRLRRVFEDARPFRTAPRRSRGPLAPGGSMRRKATSTQVHPRQAHPLRPGRVGEDHEVRRRGRPAPKRLRTPNDARLPPVAEDQQQSHLPTLADREQSQPDRAGGERHRAGRFRQSYRGGPRRSHCGNSQSRGALDSTE